jgi:hypothetical protein
MMQQQLINQRKKAGRTPSIAVNGNNFSLGNFSINSNKIFGGNNASLKMENDPASP